MIISGDFAPLLWRKKREKLYLNFCRCRKKTGHHIIVRQAQRILDTVLKTAILNQTFLIVFIVNTLILFQSKSFA
jgi:hypothetical protein